jgi:hypothetical protein
MTFVIPFDLVELVLCYFYVGRCDDPTCVHFVFKCKIINNAVDGFRVARTWGTTRRTQRFERMGLNVGDLGSQ